MVLTQNQFHCFSDRPISKMKAQRKENRKELRIANEDLL